MPAIHFAAMAAKPGLEAELEQKLADFAKGIRELKCDGYGAIYAGPVNYNEERAKPFTHVLIVEFDNQDRIFKDYGSDSTPGGKFHAAANASFRPTYDSLLVADFEAPSFATGLVHVVCFTVAQGEEAQWTEGAGMIAAASKAGSGKLPVDVVYSGPLVGKWNKGLNHVIYTVFDSKADLDVYGPAPEHQAAVKGFLLPACGPDALSTLKVFDFDVPRS